MMVVSQAPLLISNAITNFREAFVERSEAKHWQFTTLPFAKYSSMNILHTLHTNPAPTHCSVYCKRG